MSREKFEEWFNKRYFISNEQGSHIKEMCYVAWSAGRESMREEAANYAEGEFDFCGDELLVADGIRKI